MQMRLNVELDQYGVHFAHGDLRPVVVAAKDIDDVVAQPFVGYCLQQLLCFRCHPLQKCG